MVIIVEIRLGNIDGLLRVRYQLGQEVRARQIDLGGRDEDGVAGPAIEHEPLSPVRLGRREASIDTLRLGSEDHHTQGVKALHQFDVVLGRADSTHIRSSDLLTDWPEEVRVRLGVPACDVRRQNVKQIHGAWLCG